MAMQHCTSIYTLAVVLAVLSPVYARSTSQFQHWYPEYGQIFEDILRENCTSEYEWYLGHAGKGKGDCTFQGRWCSTSPIISCLLNNLPESAKAQMAAAAVVLGLLPSVLALVGSSPVEIGLVALRRPILTFMLSVASPALPLIRSSDYKKPVKEMFESEDEDDKPLKISTVQSHILSALQYLAALGMLVNLFELTWELMYRVVFAAVPRATTLPIYYVMSASILHILGSLAVRFNFRVINVAAPSRTSFLTWIQRESQPCISQPEWTIQRRQSSWTFCALAWFTPLGTLIFIVLGTFMFSSTLFVAQLDALIISVRFLANMLVARMIIAFELKGMGQVVSVRAQTWRVDSDPTYMSVATK